MTDFARTRIRFGAWLALLAMCLIVFAPLVSQAKNALHPATPDAAICSADAPGQDLHHPHGDTLLSACGYCNLLATHVTVPPTASSTPAWVLAYATDIPRRALPTQTPALHWFTGYPRAPPRSA